MPAQNGTGPLGQGPMTGRAFGPCNEQAMNFDFRNRYGLGQGRGRRRGAPRAYGRFFGSMSNTNELGQEFELDALKKQKVWLEERIQKLETESSE